MPRVNGRFDRSRQRARLLLQLLAALCPTACLESGNDPIGTIGDASLGGADASDAGFDHPDAGLDSGATDHPNECVEMFTPQTVADVGLHPFWKDQRGAHVVWGQHSTGQLILTTFDDMTGTLVEESAYHHPVAEDGRAGTYYDVAATPDGSFAIGLSCAVPES